MAIDENYQDVVVMLLDRGADIELKNEVGTYADAPPVDNIHNED
jgi:hypothetical protein